MKTKNLPIIAVGFLIGLLYWVVDSILSFFLSDSFYFFQELLSPSLDSIYRRLIVICLFIVFGSHMQTNIKKYQVEIDEWVNYSQEVRKSLGEPVEDDNPADE